MIRIKTVEDITDNYLQMLVRYFRHIKTLQREFYKDGTPFDCWKASHLDCLREEFAALQASSEVVGFSAEEDDRFIWKALQIVRETEKERLLASDPHQTIPVIPRATKPKVFNRKHWFRLYQRTLSFQAAMDRLTATTTRKILEAFGAKLDQEARLKKIPQQARFN